MKKSRKIKSPGKGNKRTTQKAASKKLFVVDEKEYHAKLEPLYKKLFAPRTLIQFAVILPFHIPIPESFIISVQLVSPIMCTYHFSTFNTVEHQFFGSPDRKSISLTVNRSRVEMIYATEDEIEWKEDTDLSDYFDILEENLNLIITSYLVVTKDTTVYRVSREMFQAISPCNLIQTDPWKVLRTSVFILHSNLPYEHGQLTVEQTEKIVWYVNVLNQKWNPFLLSQETYLDAMRYFREGFYREAVIYSQTSAETLLSALYMQLLFIEGKTQAEAEAIRENAAFIPMVKKEFHPRLGGTWNVNDESTEVGKWYRDTYKLRNRVAHGGYFPTFDETQAALDGVSNFWVYVISLIIDNKKKYPTLQGFIKMGSDNEALG